jgi:hypothetical protein
MRYNPKPEREIPWQYIRNKDQAERLNQTLAQGEIPDFSPTVAYFGDPMVRDVVTSYRMWAYINKEFSHFLARAMEKEFGDNATYLEIMSGMGWLAKGLLEADLSGIYIATDLEPPEDAVFPVSKVDAVEAIKTHRDNIDAFVISWPPYDDPIIEACVDEIPSKSKIIYIGEGPGGCCGTAKFFKETERVFPWNAPTPDHWDLAQEALYTWPGMHDHLSLFYKI